MSETELGAQVRTGASDDAARHDRLFSELYEELHRIAQRELRRNAAATVSPTTLLHETFLSMSRRDAAAFPDHAHFMAYAARAMRGLLIDYLRSRQAQKRGGKFEITSLRTEAHVADNGDLDIERLAAAIDAVAQIDPRLAECVDLKFFCGFSLAEIADMWSVSERTVRREWEKARILLYEYLADGKLW
jgi:RNA polymerase sigma factor (TIGR02999 family)